MGNGWILFKFSTVHDREFVWINWPWFVSGLNLIFQPWVPMFDPYSANITHVDQWTTVTRLPQEFWEDTQLASLLSRVRVFLKADEYTLNRGKANLLVFVLMWMLPNLSMVPWSFLHLILFCTHPFCMKDFMKSVLSVVVWLMLLRLALILPKMFSKFSLKNLGLPCSIRIVWLRLLAVGVEVLLLPRAGWLFLPNKAADYPVLIASEEFGLHRLVLQHLKLLRSSCLPLPHRGTFGHQSWWSWRSNIRKSYFGTG